VLIAAAALAGCGNSDRPSFSRADVAPLIALSNRIADESACGQARDIAALRTRAVGLVNQKRVPTSLQEPFLSGVNTLADGAPVCVPTPPAAPVQPAGGDKPGKVPHDSRGHGHGKHGHEK
jgi:hypothetical protein